MPAWSRADRYAARWHRALAGRPELEIDMPRNSDRFDEMNSSSGRSPSPRLRASPAYFDYDPLDRIGAEQMPPLSQSAGRRIHRNPDGTIDFDFYRRYVAALRRHAMRDDNLGALSVCVLAIIITLAIVFLTAAAPVQAPNHHTASVQSEATPSIAWKSAMTPLA